MSLYMKTPPYITTPGDSIRFQMEDAGITFELFAQKMGITEEQLRGLIDGKYHINEEIAKSLAKVFQKGDYKFWLRRKDNFIKALVHGACVWKDTDR